MSAAVAVDPQRPPVRVTERWLMAPEDVLASTGLSRTALHEMIRTGEFPRPRFVGKRRRWFSDVVQRWINSVPTEPVELAANRRDREAA